MSPLHPETPPLVPLSKGHRNTGLLTLNTYLGEETGFKVPLPPGEEL